MAARAGAQRPPPEIIDLLSDSDDDTDDGVSVTPTPRRATAPLDFDESGNLSPIDEHQFYDAFVSPSLSPRRNANPAPAPGHTAGGQIINIGGEDVFIPDEDEPFLPDAASTVAPSETQHDNAGAVALSNEAFTADTCLQRVLEIFPDISHDHVTKLYNDFEANSDYENLPGPARLDNIIDQLVSAASYPKQEKGKQPIKKRKREDSIDEGDTKKWEGPDRVPVPHFLKGTMQAMLKSEFPEIPVNFVNETLAAQKHFYQAYITLADAKDNKKRAYGKGRPSMRNLANADTMATNCGWPELLDELKAVRKRVEVIRAQRAVEDEKKKAEDENLQRAKERGETAECQACFDELPMNRQMHCDGPVAHFTCYDCAEAYIKSEVSESRCRVLCTAGCGAGFAPNQLNLLADKPLLEQLAELEQEKAIRDAGLDDLEECPFCDYKVILPPVEEDFEFRCANPECEKVSCRRCKSVSHIPISCEQHAKDNKVNHRHKIEEAMTAALIRSCNKCKKQFIKEYGCNKMTCPSCANLQCYVCSESLKNYDHFDQAPGRALDGSAPKKCPLYDNVEERHEREVKEAEATARAQVAAENPDVSPDDLEIKVSDAVKKSTADRIKKGGGADGGMAGMAFPMYHAANMREVMRAMHMPLGDEEGDDEDPFEQALAGADAVRLARHPRLGRVWRDAAVAAAAMRRVPRAPIAPHLLPNVPRPVAQPPNGPAMQGFIPVYAFGGAAPQHNHYRPALANHAPPQAGAPAPPPAPPPAGRFAHYLGPFGDPFGGDGAFDDFAYGHPVQPPPPNPVNHNLAMRLNGRRAQAQVPVAAPMYHPFQALPGAFPNEGQAADLGAPRGPGGDARWRQPQENDPQPRGAAMARGADEMVQYQVEYLRQRAQAREMARLAEAARRPEGDEAQWF
ncbi:hypothetical protein LTR36_005457 [Oleoguttula mirabilis]|uniref:RING-type domain-containing protein n=1 Tax=Oleoguttula mirabilis TaxID=1507867 RepID=A0AAV9JEU3_9PEZI|nr:hypothetical protein LTR36_005457 [Oleoguttula mirabilis]